MDKAKHKQLEAALRESPDVLARIIGSAMDAIIATDDAQLIVVFNAAAEKMFRCPANEAIGNSIEHFIPQRILAEHNTRVRRFDESGVTNRTLGSLGTVWGVRATGEEFPIEASISKVESGGKKVFTAVIRDVTERHRAEEAMRESEQRFRLLADTAPVLIWMSGTDKLCTYFNKPWLDFTGRSIEQELGNGWAEGVHPDDLQRCLDTYQESFDRRDKFRMEYRLRHYDAEYRWIVDEGVPRFNQDRSFAGYIGVGLDISERKISEERLREHEEQFRTLAEAIPQLCWMAHGDGYIFWYNQRWHKYTGTTPEQMEGWGWQSVHDPATLPKVIERWKASLSTGEPFDMVFPIRGSDGVFRPFLTRVMPIKDSDGRVVRWFGTNTDITELREAQKALQTSEERLRLAQKVAGIGTFERNIRTGVLTWTPEMESMYGLPPGSFPQTRMAFQDLIHPNDRAERIKLSGEALKTGQPSSGEWRAIWPDGSVHWIAGRWQVLMDASGEPSRVVGVNMDITERKLTEQRLREYERAVEGSGEMICVVDRDYRYLIANRRFLKMRNMTREQVVGHFAYEVLNKAFFEAVVKPKLDECFQGEVVTYETKYSYPEVGERDVFISYFPIEGANGIDRAACIIQDITDRKRSEESLRESEERFRLAAQAGRMYSYEWDVTTDVLVRSAEYVKILGVTEPLRFTRQQFMDKIHPDDRPRFIAAIAGLTPENPTRDVTYRILLPSGAFVWLKNSGRAFFDGEGKMLRMIGMVADVTDQKLAEESLSDMTRKLVEGQEQERARIARELHDDINQRLAMLSLEIEQLRGNPSEVETRAQELRKRTAEISDDVQALSHDLHSSKLEYLGVVAGIKSWCKEFGERQGMRIDCRNDVRSTLPQEIGLCLFRVLQEALHNASKHSGVKQVDVQLREDSGRIHLILSDRGRGFDVEEALQGKGLGLTSMRERVRLMKGTIEIQSKPMGGTSIHVRVPLELDHAQKAAG
jgi:PAS domain S-box-containing protein